MAEKSIARNCWKSSLRTACRSSPEINSGSEEVLPLDDYRSRSECSLVALFLVRISISLSRFCSEDTIVLRQSRLAQPLGHTSVRRPAILPHIGAGRLFEPIIKMHSAEVVKIIRG